MYGFEYAVLRYRSYSSSGYSSDSPSPSCGIVSMKRRPRPVLPCWPPREEAVYLEVGPRGSDAVRAVPMRGRSERGAEVDLGERSSEIRRSAAVVGRRLGLLRTESARVVRVEGVVETAGEVRVEGRSGR